MRASRGLCSILVALVLIGALFSTAAGASDRSKASSSTSGGGNSRLTFKKPVSLTSFAPARTAVGTVYTATRGDQESDHEWSGEPAIQIDEKGTIYVAGTCCLAAASPVWYSADGGKTFTEMETPGHVREWGIGAEGDLAVDNDGRTYFVDTYIPGLLMSRWSEHGKTWDFTVPAAGVTPGFDDRPWIAWSEKGLYLYVNHVSHTAVYKSTDGGMSWDGGHILEWDNQQLGQPFFPAHIAADRKQGNLWVVGENNQDGKDVLGSAVTTSGGSMNFRQAVVTKPQRRGGFSPIFTGATAVDAAGNGYTTWSTYDEKGCDVYYAVSTNKGKSWQKPVKVNDGGGCATFPWIAAGDDGKIALTWYETPGAKTPSPTVQKLLGLSAPNRSAYGIDLALAPYQDELPENAPWYLHAAAIPNATAKSPSVVETRIDTKTPVLTGPMNRELWDFLQLAIGPKGEIVISFVKKYKDGAPQTWYVESKTGPRLK